MLKWKIGDTTITQLLEMSDDTGGVPVLPDATPEKLDEISWLKPNFVSASGNLILNIQMLIIETPTRKMVVDTCIGNDKNLNMEGWANLQSPFLDNLKAMGHDPRFNRYGDMHALTRRPCGLEYTQSERQMGPHVPQGTLCDGRQGIRVLA